LPDVYAFGVIAPSTLYELSAGFPPPAGYAEIAGVYPSIGGEAAGGAYVLARLGITTKLAGNRLHDDPAGARVVETLAEAGVDCSAVTLDPQTAPLTEVVFTAGDTRTVFGTYGRLLVDESWDDPAEADVTASRVVCLDPFFGDASEQVARWCRQGTIPYVTVDTAPDSYIANNAEVLIISEEFAARTFTTRDPLEIMAAYKARCPGLVILTLGSDPLLYQRDGAEPKESAPFRVEVRDTTGAGDSFRAGIIYGILHGHDDATLITTASAVAALVCRQVPGVLHSPSEPELQDFLRQAERPPV
jgi:sugar/nucleoside kinase (ribokinase family)